MEDTNKRPEAGVVRSSRKDAWIAFGAPFLLSAVFLSCTLGDRVYWQDSGFYLTAIKDLALLYPPGFALYEILCRAWTGLLPLNDFTLEVHLFSAACAAMAAGIMGLAARDLVESRGPLFKVDDDGSGGLAALTGGTIGCLVATGFTFWHSGLYAKVYSFFYLVLALLLYWMIRTDRSRHPRDFTILAALVGLAWQAHPSAALTGLALMMFMATHSKVMDWRGIGWRTGVAAACALGPSLILIPILARRESTAAFGSPMSWGDLLGYMMGKRFVSTPGVFTMEGARWLSVSRYFWEEMLLMGTMAIGVGLARLARVNRRLLLWLASWVVPIVVVSVSFSIEGQNDFWLVAAWLPLYLAAVPGLLAVGKTCGRLGRPILASVAFCGVASAAWFNRSDLDQRGYELAELYGRIILGTPDPGSILILTSDDSAAIGQYLQKVRGEFPRLLLVRASHLAPHEVDSPPGWYEKRLLIEDPLLRPPDFESVGRVPAGSEVALASAAVINANAGRDRGVYVEEPPPTFMIRGGLVLIPAGVLWKAVPRGEERLDPRHWDFPIEPEEVRKRFRRERSPRKLARGGEEVTVFEPFEKRLFVALLRARLHLADWHFRRRQLAPARALYESILRADPATLDRAEVVYPLATSLNALGEAERAAPLLLRCLGLDLAPDTRALAHAQLSEIFRKKGNLQEAEAHLRQALAIPGMSSSIKGEIEKSSPRQGR